MRHCIERAGLPALAVVADQRCARLGPGVLLALGTGELRLRRLLRTLLLIRAMAAENSIEAKPASRTNFGSN
jgi:hypothetical protein